MQVEIKVPELAESVSEASVLDWHRQEGAALKRGDSLVDIETDKVTLEVSTPEDGILQRICKQRGERVDSGELLAILRTGAAVAERAVPQAEQDGRAELSSAPGTPTPGASSPHSPSPERPGKEVSPEIAESGFLEELESPATHPSTEGPSTEGPSAKGGATAKAPGAFTAAPLMSPAVRALLREHRLQAEQVPIMGGGKRLRKKDVLAHLEGEKKVAVPPDAGLGGSQASAEPPITDSQAGVAHTARRVERIPMSGLRRYIARRLLQAQREQAVLTTFNEVDMQAVMDLRKRCRDEFERHHGVRLGLLSFFTKAVVGALRRFPLLNAAVDGDDIVQHHYCDIGIAVSAPRGLVVPVLRDAQQLSLADVERAVREFVEKAQASTLQAEELSGGTFTITNGGVFGSLLSTPILNPPQSGILGMHKIQSRPVAVADRVELRPMMYLALSYDHRIVDGREAVQFLVSVKEQLEDPARMLLEL